MAEAAAARNREYYDAGFDVHLTKPVAFEDLDRLLRIQPQK